MGLPSGKKEQIKLDTRIAESNLEAREGVS